MNVLNTKAATWGIVAAVAIAGLYLIGRKIAGEVTEAAKDVGEAVNPLNHDNVFNRGFNAATGAVLDPGNEDFSFGAWLWEVTHPEAVEAERQALAPTPMQQALRQANADAAAYLEGP